MSGKVYTIEEIRERILPVVKAHGVRAVRLFGSYARGEATAQSDIDLLIDGGAIHTLFQLTAFRLALEDALEKQVDVVTMEALRPGFSALIAKDEVTLFDAA